MSKALLSLSLIMKSLITIACLTSSLLAQESLKEKLEARSAEAAKVVPAEVRTEYGKGIQAVEKSGIEKSAKQVGDKAPDFTLKNPSGHEVSLSEALKNGPVVLTWYRGGWCPYCNIALAAYQAKLPEMRAEGATFMALTPELPDKSLTTAEKHKLDFDVLSDLNHEVAKNYGLVFKLTPEVEKLYKGKFDLTKFNGEKAGDQDLPLAATYIIDQAGVIRWAFVKADYRQRAEPADVLAFLKKLKAEKK
jgi:peroxiredoxin